MSSSEAEFNDGDSDEDMPIGQLSSSAKKKAAAAASGASSSRGSMSIPKKKKKRPVDPAKEEGEMSDDDFEPTPKKKKTSSAAKKKPAARKSAANGSAANKKRASKTPASKAKPKVKRESAAKKKKAAPKGPKQLKKMEKTERLQHAMQSFLWWNAPDPPPGQQYTTMEHAGVSFPEPYVPHGFKMKYNGEDVDLNPVEEEAATFFAGMDPDGMHLGNPKTAPIFEKNFFVDFREVLTKRNKKLIKDFKKCNFEPIRRHLNEQKIIKKAITDNEKKMNKEARNVVLHKFGYAIVDGHLERVGNYNMEPPGTFRGRGEHPKMGKLKSRVAPEQVSLNISECARVPPCSVPGHAWGELRHDPQVQWLSQWKENINNQVKYMQLAAQSSFKGKSDRSKYNKAALLCDNIDKIRASYKSKLKSRESETRQLATAMWVIDRLALRVGGEKDTDEEADTVGCCSLRVEHLKFDPNEEGGDSKEIELEFLGKDSMLFKQTIDFGAAMYNENNGMGEQVYENFKKFTKKKKPSQQVFDVLTPSALNAHLKSIMEGLTAKVFRTYNASKTLQDELGKAEKLKSWKSLLPAEKVVEYNNANREVAILCNHQKSVSKAQETQLEKCGTKIQTLKEQKKVLKKILKILMSGGNTSKIPTKKDEKKAVEAGNKAVEKAKKMKEKAKTNEEKIKATEADEAAKEKKKKAAELKFTQAHLWEKVPSKDQVSKKIQNWTAKIAKAEMDLKHKDDNKEVSLGTSKINYMDPRITVAWCKRNEVPIEKVFSKTLRDKFNWAMAVPPDWEFNGEVGRQG
uniref:DNA topoisomerase 1 n=1 Tax=Odontella aurita TaxID=265563 RepID=A0A7S4JSB1_9STRA|mmetsp:Transcript_52807/g.158068  ORF Transcript_52807/g.158068 Transcript_52807/m.158068 type:complete len:800 (+) Transcript_52807:238-2637(+)|eukprot:CAMPEP_0113552440 /NCGR_PEP_ID=MMETSP0015_2-20120614/15068_1 /TAXON_ID=2838 /ORGANISM="Odontella" /LENGTH=799 /DNA_ID=CAMNT_0000453417 /DNA_START=14 /DNA_END=2413 /DNA_ORIENTATION=+ /assembly_acc=CAM_ASM_000160